MTNTLDESDLTEEGCSSQVISYLIKGWKKTLIAQTNVWQFMNSRWQASTCKQTQTFKADFKWNKVYLNMEKENQENNSG